MAIFSFGPNFVINKFTQEKIKVRELISHIGLIPKVIPLKLFLDRVPSSSDDVTSALRGFFPEGDMEDAIRPENGGPRVLLTKISEIL